MVGTFSIFHVLPIARDYHAPFFIIPRNQNIFSSSRELVELLWNLIWVFRNMTADSQPDIEYLTEIGSRDGFPF